MLGNEKNIRRLTEDVKNKSLSHAYLITGEAGMGKKSLAELLCLEVFCKNPGNGQFCGICPACKKVLSGNHPDVIRIVHEKPDTIKTDEIREQLCDTMSILPYEGQRKIYIVDEAEKMPVQAQNAILKSLEEPPAFVTILLLCTDEKLLLDTIRSRCVNVRMEPVTDEAILRFLTEEKGVSPRDAEIAVSFAKGNTGLAAKLSADEDFRALTEKVINLMRNLRTMDSGSMLEESKELTSGASLTDFLSLLTLWYRDVLAMKIGNEEGLTFRGELSALKREAAKISTEGVARVLDAILEAGKRLKANVNKELTLELLLLKIKETE